MRVQQLFRRVESRQQPWWLRTIAATLLNPIVPKPMEFDYHISNLEVERQAEFSSGKTNPRYLRCMRQMRKLADAKAADAKTADVFEATKRLILDEHKRPATEEDTVEEGLIYYTRGAVGETLLHLAALLKLYDLFFWLIAVEPLLVMGVYEESVYQNETVLHLLVAHMDLDIIRRFAKTLLYWDKCKPADVDRDAEAHSENMWTLLACDTPTDRAEWMQAAWESLVNHQVTGTFFEMDHMGGSCYIGGTAVGLATRLGGARIIRFLTMEVGCDCLHCWDIIVPGKCSYTKGWTCAGADGGVQEAPDAFYSETSGPVMRAEALQNWESDGRCAYLDIVDHYGNTAFHVAVMAHSDSHILSYLGHLHSAGFGRYEGQRDKPVEPETRAFGAGCLKSVWRGAMSAAAATGASSSSSGEKSSALKSLKLRLDFVGAKIKQLSSAQPLVTCIVPDGPLDGPTKAKGKSCSTIMLTKLRDRYIYGTGQGALEAEAGVGAETDAVPLEGAGAAELAELVKACKYNLVQFESEVVEETLDDTSLTRRLRGGAPLQLRVKVLSPHLVEKPPHLVEFCRALAPSAIAGAAAELIAVADSDQDWAALAEAACRAADGAAAAYAGCPGTSFDATNPKNVAASAASVCATLYKCASECREACEAFARETPPSPAATARLAAIFDAHALSASAAAAAAAATAPYVVHLGVQAQAEEQAQGAATPVATAAASAAAKAEQAVNLVVQKARDVATRCRAAVSLFSKLLVYKDAVARFQQEDLIQTLLASSLTTAARDKKAFPQPLGPKAVELDLHGAPTAYHALCHKLHPRLPNDAPNTPLTSLCECRKSTCTRCADCTDCGLVCVCDKIAEVADLDVSDNSLQQALKTAHSALAEMHARMEDLGLRRSHLDALNAEGLTPLTLAVRLGKRELFESVLLDKSKQIWTYGMSSGVCAHLYPMDGLDDIGEVCDHVLRYRDSAASTPLPVEGKASLPHLASEDLRTRLRLSPWFARASTVPSPTSKEEETSTKANKLVLEHGRLPTPVRFFRQDMSASGFWRKLFCGGCIKRPFLHAIPTTLSWWFPFPWGSLMLSLWTCARCVCLERLCFRVERARPRQLTCEDVLVRYDQWPMLAPQVEKADALDRQFAYGSAALAAVGLAKAKEKDDKLDSASSEKAFRALLADANRWLHPDHRQSSTDLDGDHFVKKDAASVLEQLSERKWERMHAPRFYRLATFRALYCALVWLYITWRMSSPVSTAQPLRDVSRESLSPILSALISRNLVVAFAAFTGLIFFTHFSRFVALGLLPWVWNWRVWTCLLSSEWWGRWWASLWTISALDKVKPPLPPFVETRESALYTSAHCGRFGVFHLFTLLVGSGLLFAGALVDFYGGWAQAYLVYTAGSFFFTLHLIYFLLGWEYTGPLIVMVFSVITNEFLRWLCLFLPVVVVFGLPLYTLSMSAPVAMGGSNITSVPINTIAQMLGMVIDQTQNPYPANTVPSSISAGAGQTYAAGDGTVGPTFLMIAFWVGAVFLIAMTLMALLIAMFSRAFEKQADRGADFVR